LREFGGKWRGDAAHGQDSTAQFGLLAGTRRCRKPFRQANPLYMDNDLANIRQALQKSGHPVKAIRAGDDSLRREVDTLSH